MGKENKKRLKKNIKIRLTKLFYYIIIRAQKTRERAEALPRGAPLGVKRERVRGRILTHKGGDSDARRLNAARVRSVFCFR